MIKALKTQVWMVLKDRPGDDEECISKREVIARIKDLIDAGRDIRGYSNLDSKQLYRFYCHLRATIVAEAGRYIPDVVKEIKAYNEKMRLP